MGTTQKYSLKWNDFTMNVATTFRDLHSRHDFVDVTLACSDGSTLEAHKVILSSVSAYFRDILKTTPCQHPIIILKDTGRDEALAMLEFAYTGEVNVAQELLPSLLHTARAFRIKGLDKVESPIPEPQPAGCGSLPPPPPPHAHVAPAQPAPNPPPAHSNSNGGAGSDWGSRPHTPSSIHSAQDVKPPAPFAHQQQLATALAAGALLNPHGRRDRSEMSPPASLPNSQPPTRESSPCPPGINSNSARTPPPKRWKRSFDMTNGPPIKAAKETSEQTQPLAMIAENYSSSRPSDYESSKRFCEASSNSRDCRSSSLNFSQSMPTSPTMFERGNENRLAGLIRHHLATPTSTPPNPTAVNNTTSSTTTDSSSSSVPRSPPSAHGASAVVTSSSSHSSNAQQRPDSQQHNGAKEDANDYDPVDYRCFNNATKTEPPSESDFPHRNGRSSADGDDDRSQPSSRRHSLVFRPESAPTVLDMSPDGSSSLSGPQEAQRPVGSDEVVHNSDEFNDCVSKAFSVTPDGLGRYTCDECGKVFKHPGSLQHHRHIHRGTHRCPSCGKAFSRRWDMERHLNKSKYGCPANRFSTGSTGSSGSSSGGGGGPASAGPGSAPGTPSAAAMQQAVATVTQLELLSAASSSHNTTA